MLHCRLGSSRAKALNRCAIARRSGRLICLIGAAHRRYRAIMATDSCVLAFVPSFLLNWCAGRDMSARRGPLVVGLELQPELVVEDPQIAVAAAQYRRGHDCLDFLRHHADISLVAAVVAEAVEAEAVIEVAEKRDVGLKHHVGSPNNTPGSTPGNTSHGCYAGSDDAAGADDNGGTIDYSICLKCLDSHGGGERGNAERGE